MQKNALKLTFVYRRRGNNVDGIGVNPAKPMEQLFPINSAPLCTKTVRPKPSPNMSHVVPRQSQESFPVCKISKSRISAVCRHHPHHHLTVLFSGKDIFSCTHVFVMSEN